MVRKETHCYQAGHLSIDENYCLGKCRSSQKGLKGECPEPVYLQLDKEGFWEEIDSLSEETQLAVNTYSDLLEMGGEEAAESEREGLVKDVPDAERGAAKTGMAILLSWHKTGKEKGR